MAETWPVLSSMAFGEMNISITAFYARILRTNTEHILTSPSFAQGKIVNNFLCLATNYHEHVESRRGEDRVIAGENPFQTWLAVSRGQNTVRPMDEYEFDWLSETSERRKAPTKKLYEILRKLHQQHGGRFDELLETAQGMPLTRASDLYSNINNGVYDRRKMRNIHEWLAQNHFEFAQSKAPDLFQYPRRDPWDVFLETHTIEGGLTIIPADGFGIASRRAPEDGTPVFRLGQKYLFELTAPQAAYVVAFEEHEGTWYSLALGETDKTLIVKVATGTTKLPCAKDGTPIPLMEHDHTGPHRFAFILCFGAKPSTGRTALITYAEGNEIQILQVRMRVRP